MPDTKISSLAQSSLRRRIHLGILLLLVIMLGLGSRHFGGNLPDFIALNAGDALWTNAVYLSFSIIFPRSKPWQLAFGSFAISVAVEFSQLIDVDWLNYLRTTTLGKLLLGVAFLQADLYRYFVGAIIAFTIDYWARRRSTPNPNMPSS